MDSNNKDNSHIEFMSQKLFCMKDKLDKLAQLTHELVVQNKGNPKY